MKSNVLIVEDRKKDFDLLSEIFDENNYSISYAPDGKTAFSYLRDNVFDLIILDLVLPDVDGFEICKYIRKDERFVGVPVLFLSSSDNIDNRLIGLQLGATDFLSKDCDQRELLAKVKNVLNSKRQFDEMIKLSIYDSLTHIYNRRYFQHRLKDEFERSRRYKHDFCCMMIDIDFFKEVNDTLGHQTGDDVLKKVASIFRG
ncbi:MAG: response regulator, partial [Candidatus Omnitrophica bacterium]|nr:response regulator [Candidatus Omnitrophota bacterium]